MKARTKDKIELKRWGFFNDQGESLERMIMNVVAKTITGVFDKEGVEVSLGFLADELILRISLPLGEWEGEQIRYDVKIKDLIEDCDKKGVEALKKLIS